MDGVEERAHRNLCDYTRWNAAASILGRRLIDESGVVAIAGAIDFPTARAAIRSEPLAPAGASGPTRSTSSSRRAARPRCVYARVGLDDDLTEHLLAAGLPRVVDDARRWSATTRWSPASRRAGVTVRFADSPADISAYARDRGRGLRALARCPKRAALDAVDQPDAFLARRLRRSRSPRSTATPVAGAQVAAVRRRRIGYVGWVSCADAARGRGLGDTVTRAVTNEAFGRGADLVTLEASPFGEHTYARMGYREIYRYRMLHPALTRGRA